MASSLLPDVKDKWKVSLHILHESMACRTRRAEKWECGQCLTGEDQHHWAASVQSTSQLYSCSPWQPYKEHEDLGILASTSFTLPCRPAVQCLNQYFLKLWQEEGLSLGSQQSSGAIFQYCSQDIGKFILWTCVVMHSWHLNKHCSFFTWIISPHWNHIYFLCWLPVL